MLCMGRIEKDKLPNIIPFSLWCYLSLSPPGLPGVWQGQHHSPGRALQAGLAGSPGFSHNNCSMCQRCQQIQGRWIRCFKEVPRALNLHSLINTWGSIWGGMRGPLVAGDLGEENHGSRRAEVCSPLTDPWAGVWEGLARPPPSRDTSPHAVTM